VKAVGARKEQAKACSQETEFIRSV